MHTFSHLIYYEKIKYYDIYININNNTNMILNTNWLNFGIKITYKNINQY